MSDRELFPEVDPPPGGLTRMRARLDASKGPSRQMVIAAGVCFAAAVVLLAVWPQSASLRPRELPQSASTSKSAALHALIAQSDHPGLVSMGLAPFPSELVSEAASSTSQFQFRRVPTASDAVVFYMADPRPR
jgi:hypothetical protein